MRGVTSAVLLFLAGCTPVAQPAPVPSATGPPSDPSSQPAPSARLDPPIAGYDAEQIRREVERNLADRLGPEALRRTMAAATSIMVTHHQGMPRPVQHPDGSWGYDPPGANAMVRTSEGWTGWSGAAARAVSPAKAAEMDRILADPLFWAEPDYVAPTCTDAGARRMILRHAGRTAVRQQSCGGVGLTGRLWELVYRGPA